MVWWLGGWIEQINQNGASFIKRDDGILVSFIKCGRHWLVTFVKCDIMCHR